MCPVQQLGDARTSRSWSSALTGAILLWAALPPLDLWPLAWIAPAWWVMLARREQLPGRRPYRALWLAGFLFWMGALHWLRLPHWATNFGWVALSFYLAFYLPVFVALSRVAVHRLRVPVILAAPVVWTGLELARAHLLTGITIASLGHTQYRWIELIQLSDLAGAYGVDFVVMLVAASLARMVPCDEKSRTLWPLVPATAVVGAAVLYGYLRTSGQYTTPGARVALIQGCIDTRVKADREMRARIHAEYTGLSVDAVEEANREGKPVDLVVWPETMYRGPWTTFDADAQMPNSPYFEDWTVEQFRAALPRAARLTSEEVASLARKLDVPLILGIDRVHYGADRTRAFNSAVFVARDGQVQGFYDKMHRVLFGEYVPFAEYAPWLQRLTPLPATIDAGTRPVAFELDGLRFAPNICYESVLPHVIRRQVDTLRAQGAEPDVLVNLTNDGWYWGSSELDLHLMCGVFRAIECRKPLLIAANTGFSAWIDADGRVLQRGPRWATGTILADVRVDRRKSWYLRHGDWLAGVCLLACVVLAAYALWRRVFVEPVKSSSS